MDGAERLLDAAERLWDAAERAIGYGRGGDEAKGEQQSCSLEDARGASYCLVDGAERLLFSGRGKAATV